MNRKLLQQLKPEQIEVHIVRVEEPEEARIEESELDQMWSIVSSKKNPRWLWHAIDRRTGQVLAYVFGRPSKTKCFFSWKSYSSRLGLSVTARMVGKHMNGIYQQKTTK